MKTKLLLTAALLLSTTIVNADARKSANYLGAQYAIGSYNEPGIDAINPTMVILRGGSRLHKNFAIEGRIGTGVTSDTLEGTVLELSVESLYGVYGLAILPVNEDVSFYGLIGYSKGTLKLSIPGDSITDSDSGTSIGLGVDFVISPTMTLNAEYVSYIDGDLYDFTAVAVGLTSKF